MNVNFFVHAVLLCIALSFAGAVLCAFLLRKTRVIVRSTASILAFVVLLIPSFVVSLRVLDWFTTRAGVTSPDRLQGVMRGLDPPLDASSVRFYKSTVYETWMCSIDEDGAWAWCESTQLTGGGCASCEDDRSYPNFDQFIPESAAPTLVYSSDPVPNGAQAVVWYYPSIGALVYEFNYW